jgi:hypothetical protein
MRDKVTTNTRAHERINFMREVDKQLRIKNESNIIISINDQTSNMTKGERKEQIVLN